MGPMHSPNSATVPVHDQNLTQEVRVVDVSRLEPKNGNLFGCPFKAIPSLVLSKTKELVPRGLGKECSVAHESLLDPAISGRA